MTPMIPLNLVPFENLRSGDRVISDIGNCGTITDIGFDLDNPRDFDEYLITIRWDNGEKIEFPHHLLTAITLIRRRDSSPVKLKVLDHKRFLYQVTLFDNYSRIKYRSEFEKFSEVKDYLNSYNFKGSKVSYGTVTYRYKFPYKDMFVSVDRFTGGYKIHVGYHIKKYLKEVFIFVAACVIVRLMLDHFLN